MILLCLGIYIVEEELDIFQFEERKKLSLNFTYVYQGLLSISVLLQAGILFLSIWKVGFNLYKSFTKVNMKSIPNRSTDISFIN